MSATVHLRSPAAPPNRLTTFASSCGALLLGAIFFLVASPVTAMRCDGRLVDENDWPVEIREKCGAPDYVARYPQAAVPGLGLTSIVEHWYYNRGRDSLLVRLTFRDDKLLREETLGHGFREPSRKRCSPSVLHEGMSEYELYAHCGEPLAKREWHRIASPRTRVYGALSVIPVEEWLYDVGPGRFRREVRLESGQVTRIETGNRSD